MLRGFEAGELNHRPWSSNSNQKLDDYIREFNGLIASGKTCRACKPNAFELLEKLAKNYGDRAEVTTLKSVLAAKLSETITRSSPRRLPVGER